MIAWTLALGLAWSATDVPVADPGGDGPRDTMRFDEGWLVDTAADAPVEPPPVASLPPTSSLWPPTSAIEPILPDAVRAVASPGRTPWRWGLLAAIALAIALGASRLRGRLASSGLLVTALRGVQGAAGVAGVVAGIGLARAVWPPSWVPYTPYGLAGVVVLVLFFARESLRDVWAGLWVRAEGTVSVGDLVRTDDRVEVVTRLGARVAWLTDAAGTVRGVPHRRLLADDVRIAPGPYPSVSVRVHVPWAGGHDLIRERLVEAALISPWRAPSAEPEVRREEDPGWWRVTVAVLDLRFEQDHREMVRDVAHEALEIEAAMAAPDDR